MSERAHPAPTGPRVAVIEDDDAIRRLLVRSLEAEGFGVISLADGDAGIRAIHEHQPDLVLLDLTLPRVDGFDLLRRLRADARTVALPVIVLTAHTASADMVAALDAGADDYIAKPFQQAELLARVRSAWRMRQVLLRMEDAHAIVVALVNAVEAKDVDLKDHCRNLAFRAARLGAYVGLREQELEEVAFGALLHDIGKIAIPERILHKPGPLTDEEFAEMRLHPEIGERIIGPLRMAGAFSPIIRHHHERWDGRGYPDRLGGETIPLGARIVAIADAYDAIVRGRVYRAARTHEEAVDELRRHAGTQFDPGLVPLFIDEVDRVANGMPPPVELPTVARLAVAIPIRPGSPVRPGG